MGYREFKRAGMLAIAACAAAMVLAGPASAQSTSDITGLWSFNGGQVGVLKNADKSFTGIVVRATKKGACIHPIGEQMWTGVRLAGGPTNWWGKHVWFLTSPCRIAPTPGNTAWKIFKDVNGKIFLRGCYANWSHPEIQPVIDDSGNSNPGDGGVCIDAYRVNSVKGTYKKVAAKFPKSKCLGKTLKLRFSDPPTDALRTVKVTAGTVKKTLGRNRLTLNLKIGPGPGQVKIKVVARTLLGKTIKGTSVYKTCSGSGT